jgi:Glycoside Hydrolase Family 113
MNRLSLTCVSAAFLLAAIPAWARPPEVRMVAEGDVSAPAMHRLQKEAVDACARVQSWLGVDVSGPPITCHVFATLEAKGLATGYTLPTHSYPLQGDVYAVAEAGFEGELGSEVAAVVLARRFGAPRTHALGEGLAVACSAHWRRDGVDTWAACVAGLPESADLDDLLVNRRFDSASPLVRRALAGALAKYLVETRGAAAVVDGYSSWAPKAEQIAALEPGWHAWLSSLRRAHPLPTVDRKAALAGFQRGFCFAHEGYRIRDGYLSASADSALEKLSRLGTNAISVTPFSFMRTATRPAPLPFSDGAGDENDESVIHASLDAKRLGMTVMLKPHIWVRGSWPGEIKMSSEADWNAFFDDYERWIVHYALLAQMYHLDALCIGVEMSAATAGHEARWVDLIHRLRTVYGGALTYAANWYREFDTVPFWRELDFAGIDCYYPLCDDPHASDAMLDAGARRVLDRIEAVGNRSDRPVLITEVGFTSQEAAWRSPHDDRRAAARDMAAQSRCYDAFLSALPGRHRIAGVYVWKWPSTLDDGGDKDVGFTPNGKPAEAVVKRWYRGALAR